MSIYQWRNPGCVTQGGTIEVRPEKGNVTLRLPDALGGAQMTPDQARAAANRVEGE